MLDQFAQLVKDLATPRALREGLSLSLTTENWRAHAEVRMVVRHGAVRVAGVHEVHEGDRR